MRTPGRLFVLPLVSALALGACGSSLVVHRPSTTGVRTVNIELVAAGCDPAALSVPAGPANFVVTNRDAASVNEFEIHQGGDILAEAEFVTPGLAKSFAITLAPGKFTTLCTGGTRAKGTGTLTVTGRPPSAPSAKSTRAANAAVAKYRAYVEAQGDLLVTRTTAFARAVEGGNFAEAKTLYAPARMPYERIEPVAKTFGALALSINARIDDVPAGHWNGFHRIERALYEENDVTAMGPTAEQLVTDVTTLDHLLRSVRLEPATIANGASQLLEEVTTSKITGEEEQYSHLDLVDLAANVEGAQAAFDSVSALLPAHASITATEIDTRFRAIVTALAPFRRGDGYVLSNQLNSTGARAIAQATDAAAEPLSGVAKAIIG